LIWPVENGPVAFLVVFIRQYFQNENGVRRAYWALVESYRTDAGPRQRIVSWLGRLDEAGRLGVEQAARDANAAPDTAPDGIKGIRPLCFALACWV
jgi:hypothetical protein